MRLLVLLPLTALAVLAAEGCSLIEDCSFPAPASFQSVVLAPTAPAPDTLTVIFVTAGYEEVMRSAPGLVPVGSPDGTLRLNVETRDPTQARTPPAFETAVQGDTVFVRRALVRDACSPPAGTEHRVVRIEAPAGVRHVRVRTVWHDDVPFPASALPSRSARPFLTV